MMPKQTGIRARHSRRCITHENRDRRCNCSPTWEAAVFSARDGKKIRQTFATEAAARQWRADATSAVTRGGLRASTSTTLRDAAVEFMAGARDGTIRNRSGEPYKPSTLRGYDDALERRVLPDLGAARLSSITAGDVQGLVDRLLASGLDSSTVRNALMPLRAIYRRACRPGGPAATNPTRGLEVPAGNGRRDRVATAGEAERLLRALDRPSDRALWATAFFAGLRVGELLALRWPDVDLATGVIQVERSFDPRAGVTVSPKSRAGTRKVPIAAVLRDYLLEHRLEASGDGLVFGVTAARPFDAGAARRRARRAWARADAKPCTGRNRDGSPCRGTPKRGSEHCWRHQLESRAATPTPTLEPIGFHEARHTFASLMIDAGVNVKALSAFMGHASIAITLDRYGHLLPGGETEAAALIDAYLERANTRARLAQVEERAPVARHSAPETGGFQRITADNAATAEGREYGSTMRDSA